MHRPCTPGEVARLIDFLDPVDRDRHAGIARMIFVQIAVCPWCQEPIRRIDPRRLVDGELHHLTCASDAAAGGGRAGGRGGGRRG